MKGVLSINTRNRNNIQVLNYGSSFIGVRGALREFGFEGAKDGVPSMMLMSFADIEYANSKNPSLFANGVLTFREDERDEIYNALNIPNWKETLWTEESIENALLYPTKAKMQRICAVKDILTIERIRGKLTHLLNTGIRRPIENVINVVNGRWKEIQRGERVSAMNILLPEENDEEKNALKAQNDHLAKELEEMKKMMASLLAAQGAPVEPPVEEKKEVRPKATTKRKVKEGQVE